MAIIIPTHRSSRTGTATAAVKKRSDADMIRSRLLYKLGIYDPNFTNASIYHKHHKQMHSNGNNKKQSPPQTQRRRLISSMSPCQEESQDTDDGPANCFHLEPLKFGQDSQGTSTSSDDSSSPHLISSCPSSSTLSLSSSVDESPSTSTSTTIQDDQDESKSKQEPSSNSNNLLVGIGIQFDPSVTIIPIPSHKSYSPHERAQIHVPKEELALSAMRNAREFVYEGWDWRNVIEEDGMYVCGSSGEHIHPAHVRRGGYKRVMKNPYL